MDIKRFYKKVNNILEKDGYVCIEQDDKFIKKIGDSYHKIHFLHTIYEDDDKENDFDEGLEIKVYVLINEFSNKEFLLSEYHFGFGIFKSSKKVLDSLEQPYILEMKPRVDLLFPIDKYIGLLEKELPDLSPAFTNIWIDIHDGCPVVDDNLMRLNVAFVKKFINEKLISLIDFYKKVVIESKQPRSINAYNRLLNEFDIR